ncbi:MAG: right-handed parallel beta-helix repeat-containing protein [Phenylobacterium sp.]|uniref:right-handed parallel beta-helix repeat-containing protein n=1 Tax=Phenylobacterium sp. TaxID=1871053 RepID=UPI001A4D9E6E|nr:right-handed parallel beta-helix repeat-containing protein [Phenylobacterium sp.]MBL8554509.1 right-handed parallel beta-helix repeat-containing protein [Phenylobacterium sp.]
MQALGGKVLGAAFAALVIAAPTTPALAAVRNATPATFAKVVSEAKGGDVIVMGPGTYADFRIAGRAFAPELTLDARAATIVAMQVTKSEGITIRGGAFRLGQPRQRKDTGQEVFGAAIRFDDAKDIKVTGATFVGPGHAEGAYGEGNGLHVVVGQDISVEKNQFTGFRSGVVITRVKGFRVADNTSSLMRSDGFQVSKSWDGVIENNSCKSTRVRSDEHPDCIQLWSRPEFPPTSDVVIRGNRMQGPTQGIGMFNHVRKGVDDGGFDRITIENNEVNVSRPNGISLVDARKSTVRNNRITTIDGARFQAKLRTRGDVARCGNFVASWGGRAGIDEPKC